MAIYKNEGYNPEEIEMLRQECKEAGASFVYCEEEEEALENPDTDELQHVQFVGKYKGEAVIYDAVIYTLRLHHSSMVYEKAVEQVQKQFPAYKAIDERGPDYVLKPEIEEEADELIAELIEAYEEDEEVKVKEYLEMDIEFEYGVGLDVCLNATAITDDVIANFVEGFNEGTFKLDPTLYSFSSMEDEED